MARFFWFRKPLPIIICHISGTGPCSTSLYLSGWPRIVYHHLRSNSLLSSLILFILYDYDEFYEPRCYLVFIKRPQIMIQVEDMTKYFLLLVLS